MSLGILVAKIIILFVALPIHEFFHAWVADYLGDPTARLMGRKTLNPLAHLDPIGTLMLLFSPIGWGKPVRVDPFNFRNPRRDQALVSLAGPGSNLILALVFSIILRVFSGYANSFLFNIGLQIIFINIYLAIFNLIPIGPLDGFKIVLGILPRDLASEWEQTERYGLILLVILLFLPIGSSFFGFISNITNLILRLFMGQALPAVV